MYSFNNRLYLGSLLALQACTEVMGASVTSGVLEVDLVFPRNETYAPTAEMPVVFAIQNPHLVGPLNMNVFYFITPYRDYMNVDDPSQFDLSPISSSDNDPYFLYNKSDSANTEGIWELTWAVDYGYCKGFSGEPLFYTNNSTISSIVFTTKSGAAEPDLAAATKDGVCATGVAAWNVTKSLDAEKSAHWADEKCAFLSRRSPWADVDPCAVKFDAATASNISIALNISTSSNSSADEKDSGEKKDSDENSTPDNAGAVHLPMIQCQDRSNYEVMF
ncbi:unnamed protein product [Penicillium bialowiezense]